MERMLPEMSLEMGTEYVAWKKDQTAILTGLSGKDVSFLFSGGKDSSLALHFMFPASEEYGFDIEVYAVTFPEHRYNPSDVARIDGFWRERGLAIMWHEAGAYEDSLRKADNPCIACVQARKQLLHEAISTKSEDVTNLVLVTGYTLWDLVSYSLEYLMGGIYTQPDGAEAERSRKRFMETGQRFHPILKMEGGYSIYRPILKYNTQDVLRIVQEASIPILSGPCNYAKFRPKRILESYYRSMHLRFDHDRVVDFAKESLHLPSMREYGSKSKEYFMKRKFY
jgi:tRNA(Ile)-lysidine synthase TilS/MesJ